MKNEVRKLENLLLKLEWVMGALVTLYLVLVSFLVTSGYPIPVLHQIILLAVTLATFFIGIGFCLKIEQVVGYYECKKCHHRHVPTFGDVLWTMHMGRTRCLECPKCKEHSWQRKVLTEESGEEK